MNTDTEQGVHPPEARSFLSKLAELCREHDVALCAGRGLNAPPIVRVESRHWTLGFCKIESDGQFRQLEELG